MDPNAQHVSFLGASKACYNRFAALFRSFFFFLGGRALFTAGFPRSQPGLPKSFVLDVSTDNGEATLDSPAGKALLMEAKRKALTEEVFVEQSMLKVGQ